MHTHNKMNKRERYDKKIVRRQGVNLRQIDIDGIAIRHLFRHWALLLSIRLICIQLIFSVCMHFVCVHSMCSSATVLLWVHHAVCITCSVLRIQLTRSFDATSVIIFIVIFDILRWLERSVNGHWHFYLAYDQFTSLQFTIYILGST